MEYIAYLFLFLLLFWGLYVLVMGVYRAHLDNRLHGLNKVLALPYIGIGVLFDVIANVFIASILFMEPPKEFLVTSRLQRYMKNEGGRRRRIALYICDHLLDIFDPRGNHC